MAINGGYVVRETTANLTRNITLTVASILTVFVTLAIVGTTVLVRQGAQNMTRQFEGGVEFVVYLDPKADADAVASVRDNLESNPQVAKAEYVDRDATYKEFRRLFADDDLLLSTVEPEHLPTSFKVSPKDKSPQVVQELVRYYRQQPDVFQVRAAIDVLRQMEALTNSVNMIITVFAAVLLGASCLLILNTIRTAMFARRREIEVMKLVGATNWFIRVPFMLEGLVQGLIGGIMAVGAVFGANWFLENKIANAENGFELFKSFSVARSDVFLASGVVILVAILLSAFSALVATRRFLDV